MNIVKRFHFEEIISTETLLFWKSEDKSKIGIDEIAHTKAIAVETLSPVFNILEQTTSKRKSQLKKKM